MRRLFLSVGTAIAVVAGLLGAAAPAQAVVNPGAIYAERVDASTIKVALDYDSANTLQVDLNWGTGSTSDTGNGDFTPNFIWTEHFLGLALPSAGFNLTVSVYDPSNANALIAEDTFALPSAAAANNLPEITIAPYVVGDGTVGNSAMCGYGVIHEASVAISWRSNGVDLPGETDPLHLITAAEANTNLTCVVVATNGNGNASSESDPLVVGAVPPPTIDSIKITGLVRVGGKPTCSVATSNASIVMIQWRRDGVDMPKQVDPVYNVLPADYGHVLSCRASASNGTDDVFATSAGVKVAIGPALVNKSKPTLKSYVAKIGVTLRLKSVGRFSPAATTYKVQWYKVLPKRGAKLIAIKGATRSYLKVSRAFKGYRLVLKVVAYRTAYKPGVAYTAATTIVK